MHASDTCAALGRTEELQTLASSKALTSPPL